MEETRKTLMENGMKGAGMKEILDELREQIEKCSVEINGTKLIGTQTARILINRAELEWEADKCKEWELNKNESFVKLHSIPVLVDEAKHWKVCPYCGKKIKISEVE